MKAVFDKQELLSALTAAAGISQTKNTFAAVDGLLFECPPDAKFGDYDTERENLCRISAFDLEKGLRTSVTCTVAEKGMAVLNTAKTLQIVRTLPDGEITVEVSEKGRALISGGSFRFEITASPASGFPSMPMFIGEKTWTLPQHLLRSLIERTVYAVAQNDPRAAFNGALFRIENGTLTAVGSDTFRIAIAKADLDAPDTPDVSMIIPGKFLTELLRLLRDSEDPVTMMLGRKHVIFRIDSIWFFTRLIDAEYVDYRQFLPSAAKTTALTSRNLLSDAVAGASVVTDNKPGSSCVRLMFSGQSIAFSSVSSAGSVSGSVPADVSGQEITIAFICRYLSEALKAFPETCENVRILLNSPGTGILIQPEDGEDTMSFILPYRIRD